ncbi:MAG: lipoprotein [Acidiferrobacterales bacterium]|nr:lipoprotein [Acidiferrobacterales bacterium]
MNLTILRYVALLLLGTFVATAVISGCGNKGPLYLPDSVQQPADDANKKKSKRQD